MKHTFFKLFLTVLLLTGYCINTSADTFTDNGIKYEVTSINTVKVVSNSYSGNIVIPSSVKPLYYNYGLLTFSVTSIDACAFDSCTGLTSVTIPNSVTSIGGWAFHGCTGLKSVDIPNSVTSLGDHVFYGCTNLTSVTIPNSVTSIDIGTFYGCSALSLVTIDNNSIVSKDYEGSSPDLLSKIFGNGVKKYIIGESVKRIGNRAFKGCTSLTSVTIPSSVKSIGVGAFEDCNMLPAEGHVRYIDDCLIAVVGDGLSECTIRNGTRLIASFAFFNCTSLTSVTIPNSVTSICWGAFYGCSGLTSIIIPNSITSISESTFFGCSSLTSISIPNSVTSIGSTAFKNCTSLTSITIPDSVTSINESTFFGCSSLTSISIPSSVTSIGSTAFKNCTGLTSIIIPNSVTSIHAKAFEGCSPKRISINSDTIVSSISLGKLFGKEIEECIIGDEIKSIYNSSFKKCVNLKSISIGDSVTSIGSSAFSGCSSLTSINIPNSVTSIGDHAFYGCSSLPAINNIRYADTYVVEAIDKTLLTYSLKEGTRFIGSKAFGDCENLVMLSIPNSVILVGDSSFSRCISLSSIRIPNSVKSICNSAFYGCSGMTSVSIGNSVTSIGDSAFCECSSLTSLRVPNSVKTIGIRAFYYCSGLVSAVLSDSVTAIGMDAFLGCSGLTSITISNSLTSISQGVFLGCVGLTSVIIPDSVTSIDDYAFRGCTGLTSITIPSSVTSIGYQAFYGCSNLTNICTWVAEPISISSNRFSNYTATLYVPEASVQKYKNAENWKNFNILAAESLITLSDTDLETTTLNTTFSLSATITSPFISNKSVVWSSSDTNIATVSDNGLVTTVGFGTATITAQSAEEPNLKATCTVFVRALVTDLSLDKTSLTFTALGGTQTINATITPDYAVNKTIRWTSSNTGVATVSSSGVVTPRGSGTATITAATSDGTNLSATCIVTVNVATGISLDETSLSFSSLDETKQLTANIAPDNVANGRVAWSSSNTSVATVDENGIVTPKANGRTTITASTTDGTNFSTTCSVVVAIATTGISLDKTSLAFSDLYSSTSETLTATVFPSNAANKAVAWESSNTTVATVSSNGVVKPVSSGTATITVRTTDGTNLSATCEVYVNVIASVTLDKTALFFNPNGEPQQLIATILPANAANKYLIWTSNDVNVADVDEDGVVTPIEAGNAIITATTIDGTNIKATCAVTVSIVTTSITLDKTSLSFNDLYNTETLTATVLPDNTANKIVAWESSNTAVAEVSGSGVVTPKSYGTAIITATTTDGSNMSATCEVSVKVATDISLDKTSISFTTLDDTQKLTAIISPADAATKNAIWMIDDSNVATIDNNGVVTPVGNGTTTITAITLDGTNLSATCQVTVETSAPVPGDLNGDNIADVSDIVAVISYALDVDNPAGDVTGDGVTDVADIVAIIDYALNFIDPNVAPSKQYVTDVQTTTRASDYITGEITDKEISISLSGQTDFTAFQFLLTLPDNVSLSDATCGAACSAHHGIVFKELRRGCYKVIGYASDNLCLNKANSELLRLTLSDSLSDDAIISNVYFAKTDTEKVRLNDLTIGLATSVNGWKSDQDDTDVYYNLQGQRVYNPVKGNIYIHNGKTIKYDKQR